MKLITQEIRECLLINGTLTARGDEHDFMPVVKFFNPCGAATWLITEMDPEYNDILFGLCDLGFGFPELGSVSLSEIEAIQLPLGLRIERDLHFVGRYPLSVYTEAARRERYITEDADLLAQAKRDLDRER